MAALTIDFALPIGLLVVGLICVLFVRVAEQRGLARAEKKTRELVDRFGMQKSGQASSE